MHTQCALKHIPIAPFSVCVEQGLVLLLRLSFAPSGAQDALELAVLSPQPLGELRLHTSAPKPGLSFMVSKVNPRNL